MKWYIFFSLLIGLFYSCSVTKNYHQQVFWEENFNQEHSLDTNKWSKIPRGGSDWNRHMSNDDNCYALKNGKMILRGIRNRDFSKDTSRYLTGGIYTKDKVSFGFGRLEIRAKLNGATGAWPAFWMLAENSQWPNGGEIDIMERLNFDTIAYQTIHTYYTLSLKIKDNPKSGATAKINPNDFNTYALEKYPDSLVFFVNNKKTFTYPKIATKALGQFPFNEAKHYLLIDMQLGGSWVGKIKDDQLPVEMEIDWVKFYQFKNKR
ncbi:glycoside hydrolase family 16 protein [Pedobacter sp. Hv1]|uniref:glycoside hydrolase family 16 protein n=1 Tax=Pedobacter sp. Hv1 TaxID=1740090 RepID=UPI0006D8B659|nr:glycoside hydrolase family 16 protein [Pedobacter sp. Hv1]KQC00260.1 beta-glucanase [Pedobacter sp. Hv1]